MEPRNHMLKILCKILMIIIGIIMAFVSAIIFYTVVNTSYHNPGSSIGDTDNSPFRNEALQMMLLSTLDIGNENFTACCNESSDSYGCFLRVLSPYETSDMPTNQVYSAYVKNIILRVSDLNASIFNSNFKHGFQTGHRDLAKFNLSMVNFITALQIILIVIYFKPSKRSNPYIKNVKITYLNLDTEEVIDITINSKSQKRKIYKLFRNIVLVGFFLILGCIVCDMYCDGLISFGGFNFSRSSKFGYNDLDVVENWLPILFSVLDVILMCMTFSAYKIVSRKLSSTVDILNVMNNARIYRFCLIFRAMKKRLSKALTEIMLLGILLNLIIYNLPYDFYGQVILKFLLASLLVVLEIILISIALQLYKTEKDKIESINGLVVTLNIVKGYEKEVGRQLNLKSRLQKIVKAFFTIMLSIGVGVVAVFYFVNMITFFMVGFTGSNVGVTDTTAIKHDPAFPTFLLTPSCNKNISVAHFSHEFCKLPNGVFDYDELKFKNCSAILHLLKQASSFDHCDHSSKKPNKFLVKNFAVRYTLSNETNSSSEPDKLSDKNFTVHIVLEKGSNFFRSPGNFSVPFPQKISNKPNFTVHAKLYKNVTMVKFSTDEGIINNHPDSLKLSESCDVTCGTQILFCFLVAVLQGFTLFWLVYLMENMESNPSTINVFALDTFCRQITEIE